MYLHIINLISISLVESKDCDPEAEAVILKDLDRTFPHNFIFQDKYGSGQRQLYHVLSAYSKYNKSTGYVQGMGFITALLLTYMDQESSFFFLDCLMKKYGLEGFYLPDFPELKKNILCHALSDEETYTKSI